MRPPLGADISLLTSQSPTKKPSSGGRLGHRDRAGRAKELNTHGRKKGEAEGPESFERNRTKRET